MDDLGVILKRILTADRIAPNAAQVHPLVCAADRDDCICSHKVKVESTPRIGVILSAADFEWL